MSARAGGGGYNQQDRRRKSCRGRFRTRFIKERCPGQTAAHLKREQQQERLDAVVTPVHKVPQEEIVLVWTFPPDLEELHQVVELSMDVPAYLMMGATQAVQVCVPPGGGRYHTHVCETMSRRVYLHQIILCSETPHTHLGWGAYLMGAQQAVWVYPRGGRHVDFFRQIVLSSETSQHLGYKESARDTFAPCRMRS